MSSRKKKPVEPAKMGANDKKMEKLRPEPAMPQEPETESIDNDGAPAVAIIGMAGRFPGAPSVDALWALLKEGKEAITRFSDKELETAGVDPEVFKQSGYVPVRGLIDEPEAFDAAFFGIGPHEALLMDPQQRLFLETCWHGLEHSGYAPNTMKHVVGVWGGMSTGMTNNTYLLSNLHATPDALSPEQVLTAMLGNENDYLTTRVSYKLNLRGPSVNVQTACSTSLVAVVHAAQSLLTYGCDVALAGGVSVSYPQAEGYMYQEGGIGSPDGHCRPFDSEAQGTVFSNGVGVVVLKRLEDAEADGDTIYGVIRGFGMNNDGSDKVSFAAPSVSGQAQAVRMAWEMAGIDPSTLSYVETHGTATPLGDPIEVAALTKAMVSRARNDIKVEPCALGSVKSNFGHLDSAAGVTALIKATLCLYHRTLVPTLHFKKPNPNINFDHGRFYVNTETKHWNVEGHPRRAAVSGFGIGGTNAHLVLEEWMDRRSSLYPVEESKPQLLTLSAQSATSLQRTQDHWKNWLSEEGKPRFLDAIDTLNRGRAVFEHRVACVGKSWADILHVLNESKLIVRGQAQAVTSPVFLFAGGGAQYVRMGLEVIQQLPTIRHRVEQECAWLKNQYGIDLQAHWFAMPGSAAANAFAKPSIQLPSLFLLEYALAEQLMEWGIQPAALLGHSMGENVAATVAGVFDLRSALGLVVLRGQLFERITADAAMLSVPISAEELKPKLGNLDLATVNGPQQCTVAGIRQDLEFFRQQLDQEGIDAQWVPIAVAAHSRLLEPVLPDFLTYLKKQKLNPPKFPVLSNVTGEFLKPEEAQDPDYWVRQLRYTVQFDSNLQQAGALKNPLFIEVGPGKLLTSLVKLNLPHLADHVTHLLPHAKEQENSVLTLLRGVGQLWCWGVPVDRQAIFDAQDSTHDSVKNSHDHSKNSHAKNNAHQLTHHRRVALPLYAFEPTRFYFTPPKSNRSVCEVITSFAPTLSASAISAPTLAPVQTLGLPTLTKPVDVLQASVPQQDSKYASRLEWVEETLGALLADFSGSTWDVADNEKLFSDLGYDSLFLTQLSLKLKKKFTVKVRFRQLQEELATVKDLSAWIDQELPAESFASDWQTSSTPTNSIPSGGTAMVMPNFNPSADPWQALVDTQWHAVQVLAQMTGRYLPAMGSGNSSSNNSPEIPEDWWPNPVALELAKKLQQEPSEDVSTKQRMGPFKALQRELTSDLSPEQNAYLDDFMARYIARTSESKRIAQKNRIYYADPRTVAGFKARWKEIVYSVASIKSQGADLWDVDGNQYVDVVGGFGAAYFGQNPVFLGKAIAEQLNTNNDYGPANEEVGEAARLLCEMTQMDRASFCNTGSEAVLATMRIARTVTGNTLIAKFGGAYHGIFDEVLGKTRRYGDITANITVAPGIPASAQQHIVVLEYNNPKSLEIIRALGEELAGIIIEPVQSRTPELQPIAFVQQVRELARELDIPFIFDEIITGFRLHPRGAQHWFNVDADICAYGKVIGGGFPVGAVAGKRRFLDALDGGFWQFGDTSFPEVGVTYFAGTFVRHPLSIAAVRAVLTYLKQEGPELQARVNRAASVFCERINLAFQERRIPIYMVYVGSVILTRFYGHPDFEGLFFHHLRYFGVHMYEGRPGFLTTTHETEHYEKMFQGFMQAADAMHKGGFLPLLPSDVLEFPLTDAQAEVAVAAQLSPEASAAFNEQLILKFDCHFDAEVLQIAWQKLTQRHQSLRARLNSAIDALEILPWVKAQCVVENINLNNQETVQHRLTKHVADVFDLKTAPIVRLLCLQDINALQNKQTSMLCLCVSHLMCDGWSMEVIMRELAVLYSSILEGRYPDLPIAPTLDQLVSADSEWRNSEDFPLAKEYWLNTFKPLPKSVDWPSDFVRPSNKSFSGKRLRVEIPENLALKARQYACEHHCTLFVVLLTAYNLFLHRLTHADDLVIGVPAAGQPMMGLEDLVCHDVHFMPLRFRLDPKQTASEWVQYVKNQFSTSKEHQAFTFGAIIQALNLPRDRSKLPLISAAFNLDLAMQGLCYAGHTGEFVPTPRQFVKYDLFFNAQDEHESLWLEVDFNTSIFAESTVHHWVDLFNDGLQQLLTATGPLNKLTPVSIPQEKPTEISANSNLLNQIEKLNKLENPIQKVVTLSDIFQRQAEVNPQRTAIFLPEENAGITYAEVWKRAQQVAVYLQRQGVKPKDWVGLVFADNHDKALIGMLAILILGAAYVPIPLAAPKARRSLILEDAQVSILLIADPIAENISDNDAAFNIISIEKVLSTDTTLDALPFQPDDADAIAYVIYTSGTTGKPKGVPITHKQVSRLLDTAWPWFDFGREDRWSLSHSIAFDFSVWEIWGAWKNGAAVSLVPKQGAADPETFTNFINQQKISVLNLTPLALYSLTEYWLQQSVTPKSLRWIILGGDVFDIHRIEGWWAKSSSPRLVNMYGITEITVHATYCEFTRDSVKKPALGPSISGSQVLANRYHGSCVGQPLPDLKIYVLDDKKQPVPVGVVGEIYVAGAGVGSGYHKRTELTATKFLPDLNNKKNTMYRSGDLARQTADGQLWFMGRCDNQVQIRGYRIELSDVESAVNKIPAIREAVVIALPDQVGDLQLVAFYAVKNPITPADLRRSAIELLPTYMVPTEWVAVTTIPRTVNGKVDSKQLEHSRNNVNTVVNIGVLSSELDSANPVEQVVKIWTDVLHRPVSAEDDFFAVGGHSLLAIKILHRVENEFGIRLHLGDVFDHPTALGMAGFIKARLQNALKEKEITPKIPEQKVAPHAATNFQIDRRPVASIQKELLSAFQLRMLFADLATRTSNILSAFNVPYVLHFTGDIHWDALQQALHDVWQRHPILGVRVYTENRQWWQTQNVRSPMVLQWDNSSINSIQDGLNGSAAKPFIFDVKGQPSDSLVRLQMWRVSDQEVYGVWNLHHLIVDSWSMSQLWHDIAFAYDARQQNEAPVWSDTALDYFAWIKEQAHVNTQVSSAWKNLAADFSLKKLTWNSEPLVSMVPQDPGYFSFQLNTNQIARLDSWCKQRHLTRFLGLFAVFAETVHRVSKVQDFVIAVPMLCRDDARWANTLGLFLNTVPVPMHCDSAQPLAERLAKFDKVWKTVLSVSELPGDELLRGLLGSDASGNLSPWLTTLFSYQVDESSDTEHVLKLGNANVSLKEWKNPASKYPLSFYLQDEGQHIDATFEYHIEVGKIKVQQIATLFLHVLAEWTEDPTPVDRFDKPDALDNVLPFHSAISSVSAIASSAVEKNVTPIDEKNAVPEKIEKLIAAVEPLLIETPADVANVEELISVPDPLQTLIELSRKKPHQHSVISGESRLTRQIMMEEVASIVSSLQQQGLKTGDAIGVMMERDTHQVALLIACWNLGLTYVPLDSKFPNQRLQKMIAVIPQGVLKVVVSNEIQAKRVETLETLKAVNTPKSESILIQTLIHSESIYEIKPLPIADSVLAYLMFTSGSTGQPKAVQISRANVKVFLEALSHSLQLLNENNRFAAITRIGFDIHVLELWWPLISGAELHWMPDAINQDPMQLVQYIRAKKITHMQATPSLWGRICRAGLQTGDLQTALTGGEALPTDIAQSLLDRVTNVVNLYGPTEATVWATIQHLKTAEEASIIGQTMSHVSAQIADKKRQFLTGEAEGELILVGAGVARGYLGADDEAQKAFFQIIENEKSIAAYATGDRVRRLPDNRLQFLGRLDQQIKIRGQRVELLDIEAHLRKLGLDAAVLADTQSSPIIVAFVTTPWNKKEIKKTLAEQLPEHMLPTRWVSVEGLPLNANGKVDRSFLMTLWLSGSFADVDEDENPEFSENASTSSFATPYAEAVAQANNPERDVPVIELDPTVKNSELSQLIRGLWKELLAIKSIEDDNDFFALGGHSLMAMDLVFSVQERFGVSIELGKFLQHPTLAAMLQAAHAHQITVASISNNSKESQSEKNQNDLPSVIASPAKMAALENNLERIPEYVPMTPLQKRLHVISQRVLQPEMFQIVALYGFKSKLKGADLRNIWLQLTQAHDAFYLEFDTDNWTQKRGNVCRAVVDWIELNDALTSDSPWIQKRLAKPLYIEQGPLAEISVIETLAGEQQLLIRVHHLIFDGESLRALLQEFLNATVENSLPSKKAPSFLRYAWNASQSNAQRTSANAYWLEQLNQSLPVLDWVLPDSRPPVKQSRGALLSRQLSSTHTQALVDLAREQKCSIQELLLTIHAALLSYLTGAEEVMVGVPFLPLHEREDYQVVGCRIEVLPVRLGFSFGASFKQLVEATCEALRSAISHGHANFTEVLESIRLSPDMSRTPLYQSLFTFLDNRSTQAPVGLKNWHEVWINRHVVQHDLDAWLFLSEQGLEIHWEYDIALFSLQQIEKAMDIFIKGLESAAHNSATQPLLWNEKKPTPVLVGNVVSIKPGRVLGVAHSLAFERLPKPVLSLGQHAWNYRQLWQAACAVRDALIAENVVPDAFVGICMTRGPEWLPAILGIWLAGAAYVPLDPDYPIDRICSMLEDSGMQHVIADSLVIDEIPELERVKVIAWQSTWWDRDSGADSAQFEVQSVIRSANQPAYMIYTSGSTGKPKGVVIGHGALDSFLQSMKSKPGLKNTDRLLAVTTFSFDISILELMLPILVGAHIVMAQRDDTMDGHRLAEIIQKQEISVMQATPATWRLLQAAGWRAHPAFKALSGGEALDNNLAEELLKYCAEVWNLYGPTEATIWATAHKLESADDILSLGQPVANTELYILDASGRSVPPFVRGELVIAGDCVALGYHNREALNRERFFEINGRRVYRTGDWVSFNNQNNIRFHGRIDHQIKLRGFRIELGEIERVLEQHPEVRKSIVFVTGEENRQHLVACLQIQGEQTSAEQIRIYLENHLPMYMVPTQWIVVQDLPTTPSGKIDRARLMSLASEHRQEPQEAVVWANADIEFLAGCWAKILQLDMIRPTDHFFSLGGHSLLAMRVIEQIQREKKVRFTIRDLVMANLEQLAERLNNAPLVQDYKLIEPFAVEEEKRPWWKFSFKSKK